MELKNNLMQIPSRPRTLVIGDIHGSAKALRQVLDRAMVNEKDTIIQLGDVADGWSETSDCVDILLDLNETNKCIFIRGNHDVWVYDWLMFGHQPMIWTQQGGKATIESYVQTAMLTDRRHKNFWFTQKDWYIDDKDRLFIHAGWDYQHNVKKIHSGVSRRDLFESQAELSVNAGTIAKECHWDRSIFSGARSAFSDGKFENGKFKAIEIFNEVYIGHTAIRGYVPKPIKLGNLYNLDTGCGWHGVLTIMDVDSKEYWQSDRSKELYPNELGR